MNTNEKWPIPAKLNLAIAALQIVVLTTLLACAGYVSSWTGVFCLALAYGIAMNSAYAMLHEAEHRILHPDKRINSIVGSVLALYFPAPFHLIRQGHIGHHMRNRSDDEAFDFYFEGESPIWKYLQLYGILTGVFWVVIVLSNFIALLAPVILRPKYSSFDRPTQAFLESFNAGYLPLIRIEALCAITLHTAIVLVFSVPVVSYVVVLSGFGVLWSAMQYVHHFGANRDVMKGAKNLRTFWLLDLVWLNHNWHLNHHSQPTVPWIYLPSLEHGVGQPRQNLLTAYLAMWRGPRFTTERVENKYADRIIR